MGNGGNHLEGLDYNGRVWANSGADGGPVFSCVRPLRIEIKNFLDFCWISY